MNSRLIIFLFVLIVLIMISACVNRESYDDSGNNPPITGLFEEIGGIFSGKLILQDSPYRVIADLKIESGDTLTIEPGVELYFDDNISIIVEGVLISNGTRYRRIYFSAYNENWAGIKFYNSSVKSSIAFSDIDKINFETQNVYGYSGISVLNSSLEITNSYIAFNKSNIGGALGCIGAQLELRNNIFRNNESDLTGGAISSEASNISIVNNIFYRNIATNNGGAIIVRSPIQTDLQNNIFYLNNSNSGEINFAYLSSDTTTLVNQYNFFAEGNMDPQFLSDNDLRLYYQSPCKDAGNPDPDYNDIDGSRNDQGAFGGPGGAW